VIKKLCPFLIQNEKVKNYKREEGDVFIDAMKNYM